MMDSRVRGNDKFLGYAMVSSYFKARWVASASPFADASVDKSPFANLRGCHAVPNLTGVG